MRNEQFKKHPVVDYGTHRIRDFARHVKFSVRLKEDDSRCSDYYIQEGETPHQLAQEFYGTPKLFWVLLNLNDMISPWTDWPMDYLTLIEYTKAKYIDRTDDIYDTAYYQFAGLWFQSNQIEREALPNFPQFETAAEFIDAAIPLSYFDFENMLNDERRWIRIVRPEEMGAVLDEYREEVSL